MIYGYEYFRQAFDFTWFDLAIHFSEHKPQLFLENDEFQFAHLKVLTNNIDVLKL